MRSRCCAERSSTAPKRSASRSSNFLDADPLLIHYVGPLGGEREVKLDLADDELVLETTDSALIHRYPDQLQERSTVPTYTLEEIAGEKLRCVIQRLLCRDISDLHRLLVREDVDVEALAAVRAKGPREESRPSQFPSAWRAEPQYRRRWEQELSDLEPDVPPFDQVIRQLRTRLRDHI